MININIPLGGDGVIEALLAFGHDALEGACFGGRFESIKVHGLIDGPAKAAGVVGIEAKAVAGLGFKVELADGVVKAAGVADDGEGAVDGGGHLGESAGFKEGGHEHEIGGRKRLMREGFIKITDGYTLIELMAVGDVVKDVLVGAVGYEADLYTVFPIAVDDVKELIGKELASFLYRVEAGGPKE